MWTVGSAPVTPAPNLAQTKVVHSQLGILLWKLGITGPNLMQTSCGPGWGQPGDAVCITSGHKAGLSAQAPVDTVDKERRPQPVIKAVDGAFAVDKPHPDGCQVVCLIRFVSSAIWL
jgi:hypothetical protein